MIEPEGIESAFADRADKAREYVSLLGSVGVERGLIGPREVDRLWERHVCNCANVAVLLPETGTVADIGSGAGLPGIPLALARPDVTFTLIESMARRTAFLTEVVTALGLEQQVRVIRERAEEVFEDFDVVTSRAVAPLSKLLPWSLPLMRPGGRIVALKGESAQAEIDGVGRLLRRHRVAARVEDVALVSEWSTTRAVVIEAGDPSFHVKRGDHGQE